MNTIQFTPEELSLINGLQERYNNLGISLVQLKLARKSLEKEEAVIEEQIIKANEEEQSLAKTLSEKYGPGSLELESGKFTPNE